MSVPVYALLDAVEEKFGPAVTLTAYVVEGKNDGYHGSSHAWMVAVYVDEPVTLDLCALLNAWCEERGYHKSPIPPALFSGAIVSGYGWISAASGAAMGAPVLPRGLDDEPKCPLDPQFRRHYHYGTIYRVREVELRLTRSVS